MSRGIQADTGAPCPEPVEPFCTIKQGGNGRSGRINRSLRRGGSEKKWRARFNVSLSFLLVLAMIMCLIPASALGTDDLSGPSLRWDTDLGVQSMGTQSGELQFPNTTSGITFNAVIYNAGNGTVSGFDVNVSVVKPTSKEVVWESGVNVGEALGSGGTKNVTFPEYAGPFNQTGNFEARVYVNLTGDQFPDNNTGTMLFSIVEEIFDLALERPYFSVDGFDVELDIPRSLPENTSITPTVRLGNPGLTDETGVEIDWIIADSGDVEVYNQTWTGDLDRGEEVNVAFPDWTPTTSGDFQCVVMLAEQDDNNDNNIMLGMITVRDVIDVGIIDMSLSPLLSLYRPNGTIDVNITLSNEGNQPVSAGFEVLLNITDPLGGHSILSTESTPTLSMGEQKNASFEGLPVPKVAGDYTIRAQVNLSGDQRSHNDISADQNLRVGGFHDVLVDNLVLNPAGNVIQDEHVNIQVDVGNHGDTIERNLNLTFQVFSLPAETLVAESFTPMTVTYINPGNWMTIQMDETWDTADVPTGNYRVTVTVALSDPGLEDLNSGDNSVSQDIIVNGKLDMKVDRIDIPHYIKVGVKATVVVGIVVLEGTVDSDPTVDVSFIKDGSFQNNLTVKVTLDTSGGGEKEVAYSFEDAGIYRVSAKIVGAWGDYNPVNNELSTVNFEVFSEDSPSLVLLSPTRGETYFAGQIISFDATGTSDEQDSPDSLKFMWFYKQGTQGAKFSLFAGGQTAKLKIPFPLAFYGVYTFKLMVEDSALNNVSLEFDLFIEHPLIQSAVKNDLRVIWAGPYEKPDTDTGVQCQVKTVSSPGGNPSGKPLYLDKFYEIEFDSDEWSWMDMNLNVLAAIGGPLNPISLQLFEYQSSTAQWSPVDNAEPLGTGFYLHANVSNPGSRRSYLIGVFGSETGEVGSITGSVLDESGTPVPDAQVKLIKDESSQVTSTDSEGGFKFTGVSVGDYQLEVSYGDRTEVRTVTVTTESTTSLVVTMVSSYGSIIITVVRMESDPLVYISDAEVTVTDKNTNELYSTVTTDEEGKTTVNVPRTPQVNRYRINITHPDYHPAEFDVNKPVQGDNIPIGPLELDPVNQKPVLVNPSVDRKSGETDTEFTFTVTYKDPDGDPADYVHVLIDDEPYLMEVKNGKDPVKGVTFEYTTTLGEGRHTFFFVCEDDKGRMTKEFPDDAVIEVEDEFVPGFFMFKGNMFWMFLLIIVLIVVGILGGIGARNKIRKRKMDKAIEKAEKSPEKVSEVMCSACGAPLTSNSNRCSRCGANLNDLRRARATGKSCPLCKAINDPRAKVCRGCGKDFTGTAAIKRDAVDELKEFSDSPVGLDFSLDGTQAQGNSQPMVTQSVPPMPGPTDDPPILEPVEPEPELPPLIMDEDEDEPEVETTREPLTVDTQCPTCRTLVPAGSLECPSCGETDFETVIDGGDQN